MGEIADYHREVGEEIYYEEDYKANTTSRYTTDALITAKSWQTKSGEVIKIKDMTSSHLKNTIRMLYEHANSISLLTHLMEMELKNR